MFRCSSYSRAFAVALIFVALSAVEAMAHCFVGARFLPATLATDDPCVADEISLPTVSWSKTADMPPATEWDVSVDLAKRITEDFGISIGQRLDANPPAWRVHRGGFRKPRNHRAVSAAQRRSARIGPASWSDRRMGRHRRHQFGIGRRHGQHAHADFLFRQGLWRPAGLFWMAARLRRHRANRISDSYSLVRYRSKLASFRRCWFMAGRFNSACPI